ncbi:MAG: hypothetical protein GQ574_21390 [Crocinitomix sp.]|nr:hypothetical protein [Crocinitomix sp.]
MKKCLLILPIISIILSSCMMNVHSADRAVMLDENEAEILTYATGNVGGGLGTEYNFGTGIGGRIGVTDKFTFGTSADFNINSTKPDWVDRVFYGQISLDQKFSLVKDLFAIKFKEGIFINNYFGTIHKNGSTGLYEFVSQEVVIPYISTSLLISPEGRKTKKWQLTFGLNSFLGLREGHMPWTVGASLLFDYADQKDKFLTGFELGGGIQTIVVDGSVIYLSLGIFFSKFKKTGTRSPMQ